MTRKEWVPDKTPRYDLAREFARNLARCSVGDSTEICPQTEAILSSVRQGKAKQEIERLDKLCPLCNKSLSEV